MHRACQLRAGFARHPAVPPTAGGPAWHISALVRMGETSLSTTCGRCCAFSAEICSTTAVWAFACRYSSDVDSNDAFRAAYPEYFAQPGASANLLHQRFRPMALP